MSYPSFEGSEAQPERAGESGPTGVTERPRASQNPAAMRVRVSNPAFTDELTEHLRSRSDAVVEKISADELEVSLVGSLDASTMQMEIYLRIRAWESAREAKGVSVDVIPSAEPS